MTTHRVLRGYPDPLEIISSDGACYQKLRQRVGLDEADPGDDDVFVTRGSFIVPNVTRILVTIVGIAIAGIAFGALAVGGFEPSSLV